MTNNTKPAVASSGRERVTDSGQPSCQPHPTSTTADRQARQILYSPDGKICAMIVDGELRKVISGSRHFLHQFGDAISLDLGAVRTAERQDVAPVAVFDRESGITYRSTIPELYRHGWRFNMGWGEQIAMRREYWRVDGELPPPPSPPLKPEPAQPDAVQLTLF